MKVAVVGGDRRFDMLAEILGERFDVAREPGEAEIPGMDVIVTQNPVKGGMGMERMLLHMRPGAKLVLMGMNTAGIPEGIDCLDLMKDEDFVLRNAVLTAEGAVYAAMGANAGAVVGSRCLVVGYGRIAKALAGMLLGLGAHVVVAARRQAARDQARRAGAEVCTMEALKEQAALADFVFSTPPSMVIDEGVLMRVKPGVPVIDLASPPYGVDLAVAQRLGVNAWRESGVPGRYCPKAAAAVMAEAVERLVCLKD